MEARQGSDQAACRAVKHRLSFVRNDALKLLDFWCLRVTISYQICLCRLSLWTIGASRKLTCLVGRTQASEFSFSTGKTVQDPRWFLFGRFLIQCSLECVLLSFCSSVGKCGSVLHTVRLRGIETGISEASKRVSIFSFATQGGKQVSFYFRQGNWVQARDPQIRFPAG